MVIIIFTCIYYFLSDEHFFIESHLLESKNIPFIDYLNLSITIQSTVGLPAIRARTNLARTVATIQQILLVFSIYIMVLIYSNDTNK